MFHINNPYKLLIFMSKMTNKLLDEARVERDQMTEPLVLLLKMRSLYPRNDGIFTQEFYNGKTWIISRLEDDEKEDAKMGKFQFEGQYPIFFQRSELPKAVIKREHPHSGLEEIELSKEIVPKIINLYRDAKNANCREGENKFDYGWLSKLDAFIISMLSERIIYIAQKVAQGKINENENLIYLDPETIKSRIIKPDIEAGVINNGVNLAIAHALPNPESMRPFFRGSIDGTVEIELEYMAKVKEKKYSKPGSRNTSYNPVQSLEIKYPFTSGGKGWRA